MRRVAIALLAFGCATNAVQTQLTEAKPHIMAADYKGDIAGLERLRDSIAPLLGDPETGYVAHYWHGYTSWRIAMNGTNINMPSQDLQKHLESASADFDACVEAHPDFVECYAAGASVNGWLASFHRNDPAAVNAQIDKSESMLKRALALAPGNPRVLWVQGGDLFYRPPQMGGDKPRAIAVWRQAVKAAQGERVIDPMMPDWGKAEALMALSFASLNATPPDLKAARDYADAALRAEPDWSYVRDVLSRQIAEAEKK